MKSQTIISFSNVSGCVHSRMFCPETKDRHKIIIIIFVNQGSLESICSVISNMTRSVRFNVVFLNCVLSLNLKLFNQRLCRLLFFFKRSNNIKTLYYFFKNCKSSEDFTIYPKFGRNSENSKNPDIWLSLSRPNT